MTITEMSAAIGKPVLLLVEGGRDDAGYLRVRCKVKDVRQVFGRTDYLLTPTTGEGELWVSADRCKEVEG